MQVRVRVTIGSRIWVGLHCFGAGNHALRRIRAYFSDAKLFLTPNVSAPNLQRLNFLALKRPGVAEFRR